MAPTGTEAWGRGHGPIVGVDHPVYPLAIHATHKNGPGPGHDHRGAIWQNKNAVDLLVHHGTTVLAIADGRISKVGPLPDPHHKHDPGLQGQRVVLDILDAHGKVVNHVYYAHLSGIDPAIHVGATVTAGQALGKSGTAGDVEHLHIAVQHGSVLTLDSAPMAAPETPDRATDHPFNLHIPVPHLQPPHMESDHPQPGLPPPPASPGNPGGPFDFNPTPPAQGGGMHLDVPPVHLGSHVDWTPFPHPDPPSGEANPGNAERATDHSRRDPEDAASDSLAQAQLGTSMWAIGTFALGLHPDHGQKGDAEAAPHGPHPSQPPDPHPPQAPPTDHGTTDHAAPFEIHLSVPQLHVDQPGGVHSQGITAESGAGHHPEPSGAAASHHGDALGHDAGSSFNLHLLTPGPELDHAGATAAADRSGHRGPDLHLDPTFGHGSGTPFNLELDPSARHHGESVHGFDLQLHPPGADGGNGSHPGANPFNLHLDVSSLTSQPNVHDPSERPGPTHDVVHGTHGAPHDHPSASQGAHLDQPHLDAAQVADVGHGGGG